MTDALRLTLLGDFAYEIYPRIIRKGVIKGSVPSILSEFEFILFARLNFLIRNDLGMARF
jgi:hypothetical protein